MPNWCFSTITFYSKNKNQIDSMAKKFKEIVDGEPTQENDFGHGWMGDFANVFFPKIKAKNIECRGTVGSVSYDPDDATQGYYSFTMDTSTAWGAKIGLWNEIVKRFYPDVEIAYVAEESGTELYLAHDDSGLFYNYKYYVDLAYIDKNGEIDYPDDSYSFFSLLDIQKYLKKILPFKFTCYNNLDKLEKHINKKLEEYAKQNGVDKDDVYFYVNEFDDMLPEDFNFRTSNANDDDDDDIEIETDDNSSDESVELTLSWDDILKGVDNQDEKESV